MYGASQFGEKFKGSSDTETEKIEEKRIQTTSFENIREVRGKTRRKMYCLRLK